MSESVRACLKHALLSALLAAGLLFPLLGMLEPSFVSPGLLVPLAATVLLFEICSLNRATAVTGSIAAAGGLLLWLFTAGGLTVVSDVFFATGLRLSGIRTALPLIATEASLVLSVLVTFACCLACLRSATALPACLLCAADVLLLYLFGSPSLIPWLLPALIALLLIFVSERFSETPLIPLASWAALLAAAAFLLTGGGVPANPLMDLADNFRQAALDRLFFTEPRDVFSLSSEGFYPQGMDQLGGKPEPDETPVMQVSAPRTVYLRGVVLDEYTGRSWRNTIGGRRCLWQSSRLSAEKAAVFDQLLPPAAVRNSLCDPASVSVRMLSGSASTLFVPQRIRELAPGGELVPYFSDSSEVFITRNLQPGDTYSVSAPLFRSGDPGIGTLVEVCATLEDPAYEQILETYTGLPSHLEEPVYALAREAASVAAAPYDKALALQSWLSRGFRYTLDVEDQPPEMDFVTHFLLDTKEGYCTYFASALTVLCRMVGLPARYVEGYMAEPDESGTALVTGLSAHAWTEVYFRGFGWLTFDATPRRRGQSPSRAEESPEPPAPQTPEPEEPEPAEDSGHEEPAPSTPEPDLPQETDVPQEPDLPDFTPPPDVEPEPLSEAPSKTRVPLLWVTLLLLLLLLAFIARLVFSSPSVRARFAKSEEARLNVWAQEITDMLRAENLSRCRDESPMAFGRRVDRLGIFSAALGPVGECLSLLCYSRAEAQETDTRLLQDTALVLRGELSRPARLRCLLRRMFIPLSCRDWRKVPPAAVRQGPAS